MFLFSFVFDAVSFCVNFKVDDYFYITVNLSYVLQKIVSWLLCWRLEADISSVAEMMCKFEPIETHNLPVYPHQKGKNYDYVYDGIMEGGVGPGIKIIKGPILKNVFTGGNTNNGNMPPKINKEKDIIMNNNIENNNINTNILTNDIIINKSFLLGGNFFSPGELSSFQKGQEKIDEKNNTLISDINQENNKTLISTTTGIGQLGGV